jgi:TetR/AcrR family transcriptional regulator
VTTSRIEPEAPSHRQSASAEILGAALEQFATAGFAGTSLQQIADAAGYSKSSILYHFTSKEALLEAAIGPAVDRLENVLGGLARLRESSEARELFVEEFIDFLLEYRLEVHTFINQGQSLVGIPGIDRANAVLGGLTSSFAAGLTTIEEKLRFGVALGGAAYELVASMNFGDEEFPHEERRSALITIVSELLAPIQTRQTTA